MICFGHSQKPTGHFFWLLRPAIEPHRDEIKVQ
jgi:hypothetical protein